MVVLYGIHIEHIRNRGSKTGPAQGSTPRDKNVHGIGGMRNQRPKANKLANSRKKRQVARLTLMCKCVINQAGY